MPAENRTVEAYGSDVETAIAAGLARLGVAREDVDIEVVEESSRGLFGLGAREACVRLTVREAVQPSAPEKPSTALTEHQPRLREEVEEHPEPKLEPETGTAPTVEEEEEWSDEIDEAEVTQGALEDLLTLMGLERFEIEQREPRPAPGEKEPPLIFNIRGPNLDVLVGRQGETLAALQYITRLIVGRELEGHVHLVLDVNEYKVRRERKLRQLAQRLAKQASETQSTVMLEPMPPNERRVIHLELRDHPQVKTQSVGEGDRRKVTIIPTTAG
jgi:spoIIIJ-associated protein